MKAEGPGCLFSWLSHRNWLLTVRVMLCGAIALKPNLFSLKKKKKRNVRHLNLGEEQGAWVSSSEMFQTGASIQSLISCVPDECL